MGCLPALNKSAGVNSYVIGEDANNLLMVTIPDVLRVPIFELHCGEGDRPIEDQVQELLEALLDAALFETGADEGEPKGSFYGLLMAHYRLRVDSGWVWTADLGIAFSAEVLTPHFDDMVTGAVFESHKLDFEECQRIGLPILPEPELYRPTRFEREDVI
jgi:hypothetical protein